MQEISNQEAIEMMNRCKHEIMRLRAEVNFLGPKAEAYDNIAAVLRLLPQNNRPCSEDIVWALDKRIKELEPKPASEKID